MAGANANCRTDDGQRPDDPVAVWEVTARAYCHCGWLLDAEHGGVEVEGAPGRVVQCGGCGCHVAVPPLNAAIEAKHG